MDTRRYPNERNDPVVIKKQLNKIIRDEFKQILINFRIQITITMNFESSVVPLAMFFRPKQMWKNDLCALFKGPIVILQTLISFMSVEHCSENLFPKIYFSIFPSGI